MNLQERLRTYSSDYIHPYVAPLLPLTQDERIDLAIEKRLKVIKEYLEEFLAGVIEKMIPSIIEKVTPVKGVDYRDGVDGKDGVNGENGRSPKDIDMAVVVKAVLSRIPVPRNGRDAPVLDEQKIIQSVLKKIPKPKHGKDGKDAVGRDGIPGKKGDDGSPDTAEDIINKINESTHKIKYTKVEGLDDALARVMNHTKRPFYKGGSLNLRSANNISVNTTAGKNVNTDYIYIVTGTTTLTLPTAFGNKNSYTVKNIGLGTVTVATSLSETIDGDSTVTLGTQYTSVSLESNGTNWFIV